MKKIIAVLAGDGIGPEVMREAIKVLKKVGEIFDHEFNFKEALIGGAAWDKFDEHFPSETKEICKNSDAILFGSVGGPINDQMSAKWRDCERNSILAIRKYFGFNVNLRPVRVYESLKSNCVLRSDIVEKGIDMLCVRELSGDVYFGEHKIIGENGERIASDVMTYDEKTIELVARAAFEAAMKRRKKLSSVDKVNVLDCSKLWREVVERVAQDYPKCEYEHVLVDNMAMQVIKRPYDFDVILMPNMFGDIISDEVSVFAGSLGMLPSASINPDGFGLYEPSGGSAQDIAEKGIANPIAQILSAAMMLKYSFDLFDEHDIVLRAVEKTLEKWFRTADIAGDDAINGVDTVDGTEAVNGDDGLGEEKIVSTSEMGDAILNEINK